MMFTTKITGNLFQKLHQRIIKANINLTSLTFLGDVDSRQSFVFRVQCLSDLTQLQQHGGSGRLAQIAAAKSTDVLESPSGRSKLKRDSFIGGKMDDRNRSTEQLLQEKDDEIRKMQLMLQQMQSKLENQNYN